jgi:hypothetical protein
VGHDAQVEFLSSHRVHHGGAITARVEAFFNRVPNLLLENPVDVDGLRAHVL